MKTLLHPVIRRLSCARPLRVPAMGFTALGLALVLALPTAAQAHKAHQHGFGKLEVAVAADGIEIRLDAALDGFVGFERAPRTDAERQRVREAEARLRDGATLFAIDPAAGCTLQAVALSAAVLGWGDAAATAPVGEHADLEAVYTFRCTDGARAGFIEQGLFQAFNRMRRVEVQAVTPRGQMKVDLRRPNARIALAR
jgi:hypothetical protein